MYEHRSQRPISRQAFIRRIGAHLAVGAALIGVSLFAGMAGYHWLGDKSWIDAFLNASMLLGGMGPVGDLPTDAGKLFAGFFALYAGLLFLVLTALLLTPVLHRMMHRFHFQLDERA